MASDSLADLCGRIRQEAAGMTIDQVERRTAAAHQALRHARTATYDEDFEVYTEWYGISVAMRPEKEGAPYPGMDVYDPARDPRPEAGRVED